jgi:hypothetical protein
MAGRRIPSMTSHEYNIFMIMILFTHHLRTEHGSYMHIGGIVWNCPHLKRKFECPIGRVFHGRNGTMKVFEIFPIGQTFHGKTTVCPSRVESY